MSKVKGHHDALLPMLEDGVGTAGACCGWGVPRVQVPVAARRTFPRVVALAVVFVATWRREEAALIKSHPSHFSPSSPFQSPRSLKIKKTLSKYRGAERRGKGKRGTEEERSKGKDGCREVKGDKSGRKMLPEKQEQVGRRRGKWKAGAAEVMDKGTLINIHLKKTNLFVCSGFVAHYGNIQFGTNHRGRS